MTDRCDQRIPLVEPIRIWGVGADGSAFLQSAATVDVSRRGARLNGVEKLQASGMTIGVQHGKRQKQFQVAWIGDPEAALMGQAGVHTHVPDNRFWGVPQFVPQSTSTAQNQHDAPPPASLPSLSAVWTGDERRHSLRYPGADPVFVAQEGSRFPITGSLVDISRSGCYVETVTPLELQTNVKLIISAMGHEFRARGIVRLCHTSMGIGVEFTEMSQEDRAQLEQFISRLTSG